MSKTQPHPEPDPITPGSILLMYRNKCLVGWVGVFRNESLTAYFIGTKEKHTVHADDISDLWGKVKGRVDRMGPWRERE